MIDDSRRARRFVAIAAIVLLVALSIIRTSLPASAASIVGSCGRLNPGEAITSADGHYRTTVRDDGDVMTLVGDRVIWDLRTTSPGAFLSMQCDGNLVLVAPDGRPVWASGTNGHPGSYLAMQSDANLTVISPDGVARWASGAVDTRLQPDELLRANQSIQTPNRRFRLTMQQDGNVVVVDNSSGAVLFATGTDAPANQDATLEMQPDGNLVLYGPQHVARWATDTRASGNAGAVLVGEDDGTFALRTPDDRIVWSSARGGTRPTPPSSTTTSTSPSSTTSTTSSSTTSTSMSTSTSSTSTTSTPGTTAGGVPTSTTAVGNGVPATNGSGGGPSGGPRSAGPGFLAHTGLTALPLILTGLALIAVGFALVHLRRTKGAVR